MLCPKCGSPIESGSTKCVYCHYELGLEGNPTNIPAKKSKKMVIIGSIIAAFILF